MFRRRRPLMRAAVVGGGAYVAGKRVAQRSAEQGQQEDEQDERLATLEDQASATADPPAQDAPAASPIWAIVMDSRGTVSASTAVADRIRSTLVWLRP